jgi:metallo-beta-lactamase family protein
MGNCYLIPDEGSFYVDIQFWGAARTVTGSMHLLTIDGTRVLLECGLYQGKRQESFERNRHLPFEPKSVDMMILSHAHIDHSGNIPNLVKNGFAGPIYCTFATRDLCAAMLRDSGHIQEMDVAYVNKKRARRGEPPVEPIYTQEDAVNCLGQFVSVGYGRAFPIMPGVRLTFLDAGHILGSAIVMLDMDSNNGAGPHRLVFSGDLGRPNKPILEDPTPVDGCDTLVIESTYGDRLHPDVANAQEELRRVVVETVRRGGKLIIPAFAVGRTQELVYDLHQLITSGRIPELPVFVDSPLAIDATSVFRLHPECYDEEVGQFLHETGARDPFGFSRLQYTRSVDQSKALNDLQEPAVIISASGMAEAGRIQHHLKNNIEDARNTILIVGWQAPNTLGRYIVEKHETVKIFGEEYALRAQVQVINGFSAHGDRNEMLGWVKAMKRLPDKAFVVHGDPEPAQAMADGLMELGIPEALVPDRGESHQV